MKPIERDNELYNINNDIIPIIGHIPVKRLSKEDIYRVRDAFLARGLKPNTVKRRLNVVRAALHWAEDEGYIEKAPRFKMPAGADEDDVVIPPTWDEFDRILLYAAPHTARAIRLCMFTGLRPGPSELFAVQWSDVDWPAGVLRVRSARKGGITWRVIPLSSDLRPHLERWHAEDQGEGYIVHYKGQPIKSLRNSWISTKKKAGITRRLRMYDFRHAFLTDVLSMKNDAKVAASLAGHADVRTTLRVYRHAPIEDLRRAVERPRRKAQDEDYGVDYKSGKNDDLDYRSTKKVQ
ncbi:tyrosine-type recombinase/integrase [Oceanidesulfovibrio marinus]|uniref:tyrosine-type recombinase/integrase n=1 Tax=Oceanidesulfovibrio marinus TaxID=370038 RepID=UPI00142F0881|nr:site-specific integrase [Oceanidesulfovibrio marinus]